MLSVDIFTQFVNQDFLTESSIAQLEVIESGYDAINEDYGDHDIVKMTLSYTHTFVLEILENTKEALLKLYQRVLSALNNYILNTAVLADKYRNLIKERYKKLPAPIVFKTYEWPNLRNDAYPALLRPQSSFHDDLEELSNAIVDNKYRADEIDALVDKKLTSFSKEVIGTKADTLNLKHSVKDIVTSHVRGREVTRTLKYEDLDKFIDEIKQYKILKDDINRTKSTMLKDYEALKRSYMDAIRDKEAKALDIKSMKNPEIEEFKSFEYQRFTSINMHLNRLFNGYITIYSEAFNTKLNLLKDKIEQNRVMIVELMTRTGVIAAIHTKSPDRNRKPIVFDPTEKR